MLLRNRIMRGGGGARAAACAVAIVALASLLTACAEGGEPTVSVPDKEGDAAILNGVLARQLAVVAAYDRGLEMLSGRRLALARELRAQEQEHVDATVEALRLLGVPAEPQVEAVTQAPRGEEAQLILFAELEAETIDLELDAVAALTAPGARRMLAATAANQAQHLVLLRRALGAAPLEAVPAPFERGTDPLG